MRKGKTAEAEDEVRTRVKHMLVWARRGGSGGTTTDPTKTDRRRVRTARDGGCAERAGQRRVHESGWATGDEDEAALHVM